MLLVAVVAALAPERVLHERSALPPPRCSEFGPVLVSPLAACPASCPFSQPYGCHKVCVAPETCATMAPSRPFADPETRECRPPCGDVAVPGCAVCAGTGVCEECAVGLFGIAWMELADGGRRCRHIAEKAWLWLSALAAVVVVLVVWYFTALTRRPVVNAKGLEEALRVRRQGTLGGGPGGYWARAVELGQEAARYFEGLVAATVLALLAAIAAHLGNPSSPPAPCGHSLVIGEGEGGAAAAMPEWVEDTVATTRRLWGASPVHDGTEELHKHAPHRAFLFGLLYVVVVGAVIYMYRRTKVRHALHRDFALRLFNVPLGIEPLVLQKHVDAFTPTPCVGVSICYDYSANAEKVEVAMSEHGASFQQGRDGVGVQTDVALELAPSLGADRKPMPALEFLDRALLPCIGLRERGPEPILGSGFAFAVFHSRQDAAAALGRINARTAVPLSGTRLRAEPAGCEPNEVFWKNYTRGHFWHKLVLGVFVLLGTMVLWVSLALPYTMYLVSVLINPTQGASESQQVLAGVLIAVGNAVVAVVIDQVATWMGFHEKPRRDVYVLWMALISTLTNTLLDLAMVALLAKNASLMAAFDGAEEGYPRVLAEEMFGLIVPGYLFLPYIAAPFLERIGPYWVGTWLVRSSARVLQRDADACLEHPSLDLCWRYADVLNNFTICCTLLFLPSGYAWKGMVALACCYIGLFALDRYIALYASKSSQADGSSLSQAYWCAWAIPTSVLAALVAFWSVHAGYLRSWWIVPGAALAHCLLFLGTLWLLSRRSEVFDETYESLLARNPRSYFATNPVMQLRHRVLGEWSDIKSTP